MKRLIPLALLSTLFLAGCVYTDIIPREDGSRVVEINTTGWYLFKGLPICCGDDNEENFFPLEFFTDRCTPEVVKARFDEHVRSLGDDVEAKGVTFVNTESVTFDVPGVSFPLVVPYILCTRDIQMSGTIVKKSKAVEEK